MQSLTINKNDDILLFMAELILSKGQKTIIDDKDFEWLNQNRWYLGSGGYVTRVLSRKLHPQGKQTRVFMHRVILNPPRGYFTDHINGDKLDNRKANLRVATARQNSYNRKIGSNNKSGCKGVYYRPNYGKRKWAVYIKLPDKLKFISGHEDKQEAIEAWQKATKEYYGEFAKW